MSLPPLSQLANLIKISPRSSQATQPTSTQVLDSTTIKTAAPQVVSLQTLITHLKITTPTTFTAKVEASGTVPTELTTQHNASINQKPANPASSPVTHWSKVSITNTLSLLLTLPSTPNTKANPGNNPLTTPGSAVAITVNPNGNIAVIPTQPQSQPQLKVTNSHNSLPRNNQAPLATKSFSPAPLAALTNSQSQHPLNHHAGHSAQPQSTTSALTKLTTALDTPATNSAHAQPISHLLNKTLTIINTLKSLSPAVSQQLLPNKIINTLMSPVNTNPLQLSKNISAPQIQQGMPATEKTPQPLITQLIELTKKNVEHDTKGQTVSWLQQSLTLSQQLASSNTPLAPKPNHVDLFSALLGNLPSPKGATTAQINESRQAIARWLNQELTAQITRTANAQIQSHTQNIERSNEWQQQIEIPLRWGDEFGAVQVRIEQKEEQTNNKNGTQEEKEKQWEIAMDFELPTPANSSTGPIEIQSMSAHLKLQQSNLSVAFWSQDLKLNQKIEAGLGLLQQQLTDAGLSITELSCNQGAPPVKAKTLQQTLIDIKT